MKCAILLLLAALAAAAPARAQDAPVNDYIFLMDDYWSICTIAPFLTHVHFMVVLSCPSYPFILGFELGLVSEGLVYSSLIPSFPVPAAWEDPSPSDWDSLDIIVEYSTPLPATDFVTLATIDLFYLDVDPIRIRMTASNPSRVGGASPAYLADPGRIMIPLAPIHAYGEDWDYAINHCPPIIWPQPAWTCGPRPSETMSWGAVKSLYR